MTSKASQIRTALRAAHPGGLTASFIADAIDTTAGRASALMGHDIKKGRIRKAVDENGVLLYYWVDQQAVALKRAIQLIETAGMKVVAA